MNFGKITIKKMAEGLNKKDFGSEEIVNYFLSNIKEKDKELDAFLSVFEEKAQKQAQEIDKIRGKEKLPKLAGIPVAVKDNILIKGELCSAGSKMLENYTAPYDAEVIRKIKNEKMIFLGKTNLDEFAMGSSTENSAFKITKNPQDRRLVPGGSSGGSAVAVKAGESPVALGSDTGGSIRQPAAFCGVAGLKPTYGAVSRRGLVAFGSSLDQIGPLANRVEDCREMFGVIKGKDGKDSTSADAPEVKEKTAENLKNWKIGLPKEYFGEGVDKTISQKVKDLAKKLEKEGAEIIEISLPTNLYALPAYVIISTSEASANLARYDGIKYGGVNPRDAKDLFDVYIKNRGEGFGREVKRRIMLGTHSLFSGYYDAYYLKAQKTRSLIKQDFENAFKKVDALLTPVTPSLPFKIGEKVQEPLQMYMSDILTVAVNLARIPSLALPIGEEKGLSVGCQIMGDFFSEKNLFNLGEKIEEIVSKK